MDTKVCKKCGVEKGLSDYHKQSARPDGLRGRCKVCTNEESRVYKEQHYDRLAKIREEKSKCPNEVKKRREAHKKPQYKKKLKEWAQRNKVKRDAHTIFNNSMRYNTRSIERLPCSVCGDPKADAHHEDYSQPLDVIWYCRKHHAQRHRQLRKMGAVWDVNGKIIFPTKDGSNANESA